MTPDQINALAPGSETDRLVAEAIGKKVETLYAVPPGWTGEREQFAQHYEGWSTDGYVPVQKYSTDWSAAMLAAEEFGLFDNDDLGNSVLNKDINEQGSFWSVCDGDADEPWEAIIAKASTGPMAISLAILRLHHEAARTTTTPEREVVQNCTTTAK